MFEALCAARKESAAASGPFDEEMESDFNQHLGEILWTNHVLAEANFRAVRGDRNEPKDTAQTCFDASRVQERAAGAGFGETEGRSH